MTEGGFEHARGPPMGENALILAHTTTCLRKTEHLSRLQEKVAKIIQCGKMVVSAGGSRV